MLSSRTVRVGNRIMKRGDQKAATVFSVFCICHNNRNALNFLTFRPNFNGFEDIEEIVSSIVIPLRKS